jgi:uncharacterized protein (DUF433 family)
VINNIVEAEMTLDKTHLVAELNDPFRTGKAYTVSEAAKLAKTTPATVRRWLLGYDAPGHHMEPVFGGREAEESGVRVSFLELIEIVVAARFRRDDKVKLERIRDAHEFARKQLFVPFPFASTEFQVHGGHLVHRFEEATPGAGQMAFDLHGQWVLPGIVQSALESVEFAEQDGLAVRWYPYGRDAHIVVDPHYAAGRPVIEGTRVPVGVIKDRFVAGDSTRYLARDYGLTVSVVEEVLRLAVA